MGRITWVCATCYETFTRRHSANRHNNNLHGGKGTVVRLLEYVVGIANGRFLPEANANVRYQKKAKQSSFFGLNFKRLKDNYQQLHISWWL